jgi:parallel beta-helix repeat protein
MGEHLTRCEYAAAACQFCSQVVPKCKMNDHIKLYCGASPDHIINCPDGCGAKVLQSDVKKHIALDCQAHVVPCTYQEFGCLYRGARSTLQSHCLVELPAHMLLMSENLHARDVAINDIKSFLKEFTVQVEKMQLFFREAQEQSALDKQAMALALAQSESRTSAVEAAVDKRLAEFQQSIFKIAKGVEKMHATVDGHTWELHKIFQDPLRVDGAASASTLPTPQSLSPPFTPGQPASSIKVPQIAAARLQASTTSSPTSGPSNCRELHVDQKEGPYYSIQDGISDAAIGDKVIVHPGTYRESVRMSKPIEIIGKGNVSDIIVDCHDTDTFIFNTASGRVCNISFVQSGVGHWSCLDIQNGNLVVDACDMISSTLICVDIHGESTMPTIRRCKIHGCKGTGIFFHGQAQGIIENNIICNNSMGGVEVCDGSKPIIKFCRISGNRKSAILIHNNGKGSYQDNDLFENDMVAVEIRESGNGEFLRNRIYNQAVI